MRWLTLVEISGHAVGQVYDLLIHSILFNSILFYLYGSVNSGHCHKAAIMSFIHSFRDYPGQGYCALNNVFCKIEITLYVQKK